MIDEKKILHIVNDEKFIEDASIIFNKITGYRHSYLLIGKKKKLKNLKNLDIKFIHPVAIIIRCRLNTIKNYDGVVFHGLSGFKYYLLKRIEKKIPICWIGWGYDYYSLINENRQDFVLPLTAAAKETSSEKSDIRFTKIFLKIFKPSIQFKLNNLRKIKIFNTVIKEDHYILHKALGSFIPTYIDWNYPILKKEMISNSYSLPSKKKNILVGNSCATTNNHLDAFSILISSNFSEYDDIICPLSYGGNIKYKNAVMEKGKEYFSEKFIPLTEFYSSGDYFQILNSCDYYFSPTIRQQGFGNILMMLYLGSSIILFKENPIYSFFVKNSVVIFSVEELVSGKLRKLTNEEKEINKTFLNLNYSEEVLEMKTQTLLEKLFA